MSESDRTAASDGEAPVNPYSLLEAVNRSSDTAHTGWLIFVAAMGYLLVTVAGVTHKDLLLSRDITLPLLQVKIELTRFFLYAPFLFVLCHAAIVSQLAIVARKALEFDAAIRMLEVSDKRTHPLRLELSNFFFVQALAGPERSRPIGLLLHVMSWLTLVLLPILMLLYIQAAFLPYHDVTITWAHRVALMADVVMLALIGVFLLQPELTFWAALGQAPRHHPHGFGMTLIVLVLALLTSLLVATVPGEPLDRVARTSTGDRADAGPLVTASADGALFGFIRRNLDVADVDFVAGKDASPDGPSIVLRGRDLRYARLDRANLHRADLTGANLDGASLIGTDLRKAMLQCANADRAALSEKRPEANCATARNANLTHAKLMEARLAGVDLTSARLDKADLEAADLSYAVLAGVSFRSASLQRAELTGAAAQRANFTAAALQGADLAGAQLAGADFTGAGLQGALLARTNLHEATLRDADLEAADLAQAWLQGANLAGARLRAANLRGAAIWMTSPPNREFSQLADLSDLIPRPLEGGDAAKGQAVAGLAIDQVKDGAVPVLVASSSKAWADGPDQQAWQQLGTATATGLADNYKVRLTDHLVQLACKPRWADGSVATGVIRRALAPDFKGDLPTIHDRLKGDACPAAKAVAAPLMRRLAVAVDAARSQ
jgi:uncharacterized protein YjbI with pentapeptide repeats